MNNVKVHVLGALIIAISVIIIGLSGSYAYYVNEIHNEHTENQGVTVKGAAKGVFDITFSTTNNINLTDATLMNKTSAKQSTKNKTAFTVKIADTSKLKTATYTLKITDIKMNDKYKSSNLKWIKWVLVKGTQEIKEGDFSTLTFGTLGSDSMYPATNDITITADEMTISNSTTDSYELYVWLDNDANTNQTSLLGGSMSMKVGIDAISK